MWSNCWPLPPLYRLHVCDRLEVFEFHVLKPCRMYDEGFFYQSGYCVKTFVSYWVATFLSPAPNEVIQVSLESHWVKSWIEAGRAKEKKSNLMMRMMDQILDFLPRPPSHLSDLAFFYHFFTAAVTPLWLRYFLFWSRTTG